jgi:hypothetical protein
MFNTIFWRRWLHAFQEPFMWCLEAKLQLAKGDTNVTDR